MLSVVERQKMKILFTKHSDTSVGRVKIGTIVDLPEEEAKNFVRNNKASFVDNPVEESIEDVEEQSDDTKDE